MNVTYSSPEAWSKWDALLKNTSQDSEVDATHGKLMISDEKGITVQIIDPETHSRTYLTLDQILNKSKDLLGKLDVTASEELKSKTGLEHLLEKIEVITSKGLGDVTWALDVHEFINDCTLLKIKMKRPDSDLKDRLERLYNSTDGEKKGQFLKMVEGNPNLLFDWDEEGTSFFKKACDSTKQLDFIFKVMETAIGKSDALNPQNKKMLKDILFENVPGLNTTFFEALMKQPQANDTFESFLKNIVKLDELNDNPSIRTKVLDFAFSTTRYDHIFFNENALNAETSERAKLCLEELKCDMVMPKPETWLKERRTSSTTLDNPVTIEKWNAAEKLRSDYSSEHKKSKSTLNLEAIQKMHAVMCQHETGVEKPGQIRSSVVRTSGGLTSLYCIPGLLKINIDAFMKWFSEGLRLCDASKKNPIIFAAQAYQRFVSIHPFENGNGRISRFLMDYVLERYDIPPPVFAGTDVNDALFPLETTKTYNPDQFIEKIIEGVRQSSLLLS